MNAYATTVIQAFGQQLSDVVQSAAVKGLW